LGGLSSVRGYAEGEDYGDSGWFGSLEARTPFITLPVPTWADFAPVWLRGSVFLDGGQRFLQDAGPGVAANRFLLGPAWESRPISITTSICVWRWDGRCSIPPPPTPAAPARISHWEDSFDE